jgi:hypothetical protein
MQEPSKDSEPEMEVTDRKAASLLVQTTVLFTPFMTFKVNGEDSRLVDLLCGAVRRKFVVGHPIKSYGVSRNQLTLAFKARSPHSSRRR